MKHIFLILFLFISFSVYPQELTLQQKIDLLKQENLKLKELQNKITDTKSSFEEVKKNTDHVLKQSSLNLRENMIRTIAGGLKDMFESIETCGNWVSGVTLLTVKVISYYRDQWMGNKISSDYHSQSVNMEGIVKNMELLSNQNQDVYKRVAVLDYLVRLPLDYYEDDNRDVISQYPEVAQYWKEADGIKDDDTEKSTRKLNILRNTSKKASDRLRVEISKMANDIAKITSNIEANNKRIAELSGQIDDWNANLDQPEKIDYSKDKNKTKTDYDKSGLKWDDCLNDVIKRHGYVGEDGARIGYNEWVEMMKGYHENGYRYKEKIKFDIPDKIKFGDRVKYSLTTVNSYIKVPIKVYDYKLKITLNGKIIDPSNSKNYSIGKNKLVVTLTSCNKLIDQVEAVVNVYDISNEVEVYFKDPVSEIAYHRPVSFYPQIHHPTNNDPGKNLSYYFKYLYDDALQGQSKKYSPDVKRRGSDAFTPEMSLLTPGKHEVVVQLYDGITDKLLDQYLHHLTVLEPGKMESITSENNTTTDFKKMEGKRVTALDLGWAKYEYVFKSNQVRIEGFYHWNNQKINYTSEPLKSYTPDVKGVPGMLLTKTSGYHIYQTVDNGSGNTACGNYIVTQMKGADIKILHRLNACSFNIVPASDGSNITVKYKNKPDGAMKEIVLQ